MSKQLFGSHPDATGPESWTRSEIRNFCEIAERMAG